MSHTPSTRGLSDAGRDPAVIRAFLVMLRAARPDPSTSPEGMGRVLSGAREFSQRLGLPGLAALLGALRPGVSLEPDHGAVSEGWQALREALAACDERRDLSWLAERDADHHAMSLRIEAAVGRGAAPSSPRAARPSAKPAPSTLEETLQGLRVNWPRHSTIAARTLDLAEKTASSLRAAIEWLLGDSPAQWPVEVSADDTVLEISLPHVEASGVEAAGRTLAACAAVLIPPGPGATAWKVRIPWRTEAPSYLLVGMGPQAVALPWASVLRMSMLSPAGRDGLARRTGWPSLDDVTGPGASIGGESPVVLLGLGLRRGFVTATRLVWRMPCSADADAGAPPAPWLKRGLLTEDGDRFWEADVEILLGSPQAERSAEWWRPLLRRTIARPEPRPAPATPGPTLPKPVAAGLSSAAAPVAPVVAPTPVATPVAPAPVAQTPMEPPATPPIPPPSAAPPAAPPVAVAPAPAPPPPPVVARAAVPTPEAPPARLGPNPPLPPRPARVVLIAEDSLTASMFLSRLLESEGARCHTVDSLAGLRAALADGRWDLVCVDVDLPDAPAGEALGVARERGATVVALVRDSFDEGLAARANVTTYLRKPFEPRVVHDLLEGLGTTS